MVLNMSASNRTKLDIFDMILNHGPITAYSIGNKLKDAKISMPQSTVFRTVKAHEKKANIEVYEKGGSDSRAKILYGPTLLGLFRYSRMVKPKVKDLEKIFKYWIRQKRFQEIAKDLYDPVKLESDPDNVARVYAEVVVFLRELLDEYEDFVSKNGVPLQTQFDLGLKLKAEKDNAYVEAKLNEFMDSIPLFKRTYQDQVDQQIALFAKYEEFKKSKECVIEDDKLN